MSAPRVYSRDAARKKLLWLLDISHPGQVFTDDGTAMTSAGISMTSARAAGSTSEFLRRHSLDEFIRQRVRTLKELSVAIHSPLGDEMAEADPAGFDRLLGRYRALRTSLFTVPDDASPSLTDARLFALGDFLRDDDTSPGKLLIAAAMVERIVAAKRAAVSLAEACKRARAGAR